jgi:N-acetylglucosaminyldiphosphoundecaprenol N-acetyl-beta-D-mannosaminyltransferase
MGPDAHCIGAEAVTTTHPASRPTLFGLEVDALTMADAVDTCNRAVDEDSHVLVGVLNAAKVVKMRKDPWLRDSLLECDMLVADGQAVVWASRVLGTPLPERIAGIDLFEQLLVQADTKHLRIYLLGATSEVLDALCSTIEGRFPNLVIAGSRDGYFKEEEAAEVADAIRASRAHMLFIGMPSPRKEVFLGTYGSSLNVPVLHGVGGSFDVMAGKTRRAPQLWQRTGMEWAYRLLQEPRRMWRRYLTTNTAFIALLAKERIHRSPAYSRSGEPGPTTGGHS